MEIVPTIMPTASLQEGSASMASYPATLDSLADESQQQLFSQICKAGDCHPLHFAQQAPTFSPIRTLPKEHTRALLGAIITQHALLVGIQGRISPLHKEDILRLVASQFAYLSLEEIYKALQLERYGAYGEHTQHYQLVNATYLSQILAKYQDWIRQLRQTHRISTTPKEEVQERSSSGYLSPERFAQNIHRAYQDYCQRGELPFFSEWLYLGLCRKGIIPPFTPDEQALMRAQYAQEQRAKAPLRQRLKQTLSPEGDLSLKREIALKFFFQKCQQQGIEKIC